MTGIVGLLIVLSMVALLVGFTVLEARRRSVFRPLPGLDALGVAIEKAVEAGKRVHLSLGTGSVTGFESAPAFAGLAVLRRVAAMTSMSDKPVVATSGDGAMVLLAQDTLRSAYEEVGSRGRYEPTAARLLGPTPFSYVATLPTMLDTEDVSVHLLSGSYGPEGALAADMGERKQALVLAGTEQVQSQALLYATAQYPLIGEEVFATGAYLDVGRMHRASLRVQDLARWVIVAAILAGTLLRTLGVGS